MKNSVKKLFLVALTVSGLIVTSCTNSENFSTSSAPQSEFRVTFYNNYEGAAHEVFEEIVVQRGGKATRPATDPVRDGYTFDNWYRDPIDQQTYTIQDFSREIRRDTNLYAGWLDIYDFTFDLNYAGAPAGDSVKVTHGQVAEEPDDPVRTGYAFTGWKVAKESAHYYDFRLAVLKATTVSAS